MWILRSTLTRWSHIGPNAQLHLWQALRSIKAQAAVDVWGKSIKKYNLRDVDFVGDGDCSSHRDVVKSKPYGDEVAVRKVECVGHIQ